MVYRGTNLKVLGSGQKVLGSGQAIVFTINCNTTRHEALILAKNYRVIIWEKCCSKYILVVCLIGIGWNNNATRNYMLGSGHFFNSRKMDASKELWQEYNQMKHNLQKGNPLPILGELILQIILRSNRFTEISDRKY